MNIIKKLLLFSTILISFAGCRSDKENQITIYQADSLIYANKNNEKFMIIDARDSISFANGHIKKAINIDISQSDAVDQIKKLDKRKTYLIYCRTNNRSDKMKAIMKKTGFKKIYQMSDGFSKWSETGLPVAK